MKKIFINSILGISILPTPLIGLSSCSKATDLDKLSKTMQEDVVQTFINDICPIYRETYRTRKIADFIKKFATDNGFEVKEDDYRATEHGTEVSSGNVYFTIPASSGCDNWLGVTLQAHMDMVCELKDKSEYYDWEANGVKPIIDGDYIHSVDYKTSLGGDDGIGLSTLLSIVKHRNDFKHGKITLLFTADEEEGISGASVLTSDVIANDLVINVDNEEFGVLTKSCAGTYELKYTIDLGGQWSSVSSNNIYTLNIKNLLGDHSASCINEGRANAIKVVVECLTQLDCEPRIVSFECASPNNNIPNAASITFIANHELFESEANELTQYIRNKYPTETNVEVTLSTSNNALPHNTLSTEYSNKVFELIEKLYFGPYHWFDEPQNTQVSASSNIAPFKIENNGNLTFSTLIRSAIKSYENELISINQKAVSNLFDSNLVTRVDIPTPAWEYEEENPLCDLMLKALKQCGVTAAIDNSHGWLECAFLKEKRPNAKIISVGPDLSGPHSPDGTVKISTISSLIKSVLYCCEHINETKK